MNGTPERAYRPGVAQVGRGGPGSVPDLTATLADNDPQPWFGTAGVPRPVPRAPLRYRTRQLRRGWEWSGTGGLIVFVCWGIWAISQRGVGIVGPAFTLVLVFAVGAGVFTLCRLLGRVIVERWLGRIRRSAWVSHAITSLFLIGAGVEYLRQTEWIVDGFTWLRGLG